MNSSLCSCRSRRRRAPPQSFAEEGRTYFSAGDLGRAIGAYQQAVEVEPGNSQLLAELARIQTYYSAQRPSADERRAQLVEARASVDAALRANPDSGYAHAIRALVYDWSATEEQGATREGYLTEALNAAVRAVQLEPPGSPVRALALAFQAEVLADQQRYAEAAEQRRAGCRAWRPTAWMCTVSMGRSSRPRRLPLVDRGVP